MDVPRHLSLTVAGVDKARLTGYTFETMTEGHREHPPLPRAESPPEDRDDPGRCGPLVVERHRKADGRLLILYRAAAESR
jgi:hypothetical protein